VIDANKQDTFVFKRLEKIAIKNCRKKNAVPLLFTLVSKHLEDFILFIKSNYILNITKTTILESIDANLEIQKFKKSNSNLESLILRSKKEKYNNYQLNT